MGLYDSFPYTNIHEINLDWVLARLKESVETIRSLDKANREKNEELEKKINECMKWIADFDPKLVRKIVDEYLVTGVYFSLSDAGYFVVTYPQAWSELEFKTSGLDIETELQPEYGHLILNY